MEQLFLFKILLGCKPPGRYTEQHDIFFGIAPSINDLKKDIKNYWQEAPKIHIDAWRYVTAVDGYRIRIAEHAGAASGENEYKLFFINLGGYKPGEFEEYHYKMLTVARNISEAIRFSKQTAFFKHTGFKGATAHVDVDDIMNVQDILSGHYRDQYRIIISKEDNTVEDELNLGYLPFN